MFGNAKLYGRTSNRPTCWCAAAPPGRTAWWRSVRSTRSNRRAYLQAEELRADTPLGNCCRGSDPAVAPAQGQRRADSQPCAALPNGWTTGWSCWCGPCAWIPGCGSSCPASTPRVARRPAQARAC
ncbi:DUF4892 domain-containing protein [Pseudomonas aeruginosa]|uniref:DUF4892 domain-containing protein n=1 Tax=Pseudomonas aeruginosa TaxID=287 RepID=UPI003D9C12E2